MSAFRVSEEQIALICAVAEDMGVLCKHTAELMGAQMFFENTHSLCARYDDYDGFEENAVLGCASVQQCRWRNSLDKWIANDAVQNITPAQILKLLDCYVYQSCEHRGWIKSKVRAFCDELQAAIVESADEKSVADLRDSELYSEALWSCWDVVPAHALWRACVE